MMKICVLATLYDQSEKTEVWWKRFLCLALRMIVNVKGGPFGAGVLGGYDF